MAQEEQSGTTAARAKKNFATTLRLFLEELLEHGTLDEVLSDQGWSKHQQQWQPPVPRYTHGVMAKYARMVASASEGACTG